jgi:hypothetical protein
VATNQQNTNKLQKRNFVLANLFVIDVAETTIRSTVS